MLPWRGAGCAIGADHPSPEFPAKRPEGEGRYVSGGRLAVVREQRAMLPDREPCVLVVAVTDRHDQGGADGFWCW